MARALLRASSQYLELDIAPITAMPLSASLWFNTDDLTVDQVLFSLADKDVPNDRFQLSAAGGVNDKIALIAGSGGTTDVLFTTNTFSANTWHQAGFRAQNSTARAVYLDGGGKATSAVNVTPSNLDRISLGRAGDSTPVNYVSGALAECGMWATTLSDIEFALLGKGFSPLLIRPYHLVAYWQMIRDDDNDLVGGFNLTAFNTPTIAPHPPQIIYPTPKTFYSIPASFDIVDLPFLESKFEPFAPEILTVDLDFLQSTFTPFTPLVKQGTILIPDQKLGIASPGMAEYRILLRDHSGTLVQHIKAYQSAIIKHKENDVGSFVLVPFETDEALINLLYQDTSIDYIFEIWRRNTLVGLDWYIEWEGFYVDIVDVTNSKGERDLAFTGVKYNDLLKRRNIRRKTLLTVKAGVGESVIKEYVNEEAGPGATIASGRITDGVTSGLTIEADAGSGLAGSWSLELKENLLIELQKIARETVVDFDVVHLGGGEFEFRCYDGQRGKDRRFLDMDALGKNSAGNTPIIFSLNRGNVSNMAFSRKYSNSKNAVLTLGGGKNEEQLFDVDQDFDASNLSPWNMRETLVNESSTIDQDVLDSASEKALANKKAKETFDFEIMQQESSYYGQHFHYGDLVSALDQQGNLRHKKMATATIELTGSGLAEKIKAGFREYP